MAKERTITIQRGFNFPVIPDGGSEAYRESRNAVDWYRVLLRHINGMASAASWATGKPDYKRATPPKKDKKKGKKKKGKAEKKTYPKIRVSIQRIAAKELAARLLGVFEGRKPLYEFRDVFLEKVKQMEGKGGPAFATHIWDSLSSELKSLIRRKMPDYGDAPRDCLEGAGKVDLMPLRSLGLPILRFVGPNSERVYAWMIEDERGQRIRLQWGTKETSRDYIVSGTVTREDGTEWKKKTAGSIKHAFHMMATGRWEWQTPKLNYKDKGSKRKRGFFISVGFRKKVTVGKLDPKKVLEVCFKPINGSDLPMKKRDTGKDESKLFLIHCMHKPTRGPRRTYRIPVNDVIALLERYQHSQSRLEVRRDCCRKGKASARRALKEKIYGFRKRRDETSKEANHRWAKEVAEIAKRWGCGTIKVFGLPDGKEGGLLLDGAFPWQWYTFLNNLEWKAKERGSKVVKIIKEDIVRKMVDQLDGLSEKEEDDGEEEEAREQDRLAV